MMRRNGRDRATAWIFGADKDSDKRQRAAIEVFAKHAKYTIVDEYYDAAVSGANPVDQRPGFGEMLRHRRSRLIMLNVRFGSLADVA